MPKEEQAKLRKQFTHHLAIHLRRVREDNGFKQEELAHKAGISTAYYGHLERGVYSPTMFVLWRLAKAMKLNMEQFMKGFGQ